MKRVCVFLFSTTALVHANLAAAQEAPTSSLRISLGVASHYRPDYLGSNQSKFAATPLISVFYKNIGFSALGASALNVFAVSTTPPGFSLSTNVNPSTRIGLSLRRDSGRSESDNVHLSGLGDLRQTLRGNFFVAHRLNPRWSLSVNYQPDLLGRNQGAKFGLVVAHNQRVSQDLVLSVTASLNGIDSKFAQSYFGVTQAQSARSGLRQYSASAGLRDVTMSAGVTYRVTNHWTAFGRLSALRLVGDAAASPITLSKENFGLSVGLGYRFF